MGLIDIVFVLLSAVAIASGWRVFVTDSMVRASFLLLLSFVAVGLIILLMSAPYIGTATIFMMAVEMMVMALFMMMFMMNPAGLNPMMMVHQNRFAIGAGIVAFIGLSTAVLTTDFVDQPVVSSARVVHDLGIELLGPSMLTFETAGVTLLATMVGAVILSARTGRFGMSDEGSLPPSLEPGGEPAGRKPEKSGGHGHHHMHGSHESHDMSKDDHLDDGKKDRSRSDWSEHSDDHHGKAGKEHRNSDMETPS